MGIDIELELHKIGAPVPNGWEAWTPGAKASYLERWRRLVKKYALSRQLVQQRAQRETYRGAPLEFIKSGLVVTPGKPRYCIRAVYGPAQSLRNSCIAVFEGEHLVRQWMDAHDVGPREFIHTVFSIAAELGGDCELVMTHSKQSITIDPAEFEAWIKRANADPVEMLMGTSLLLEDHHAG